MSPEGARIAGPPALLDLEIAALGPARLAQPAPERFEPGLPFRVAAGDAHQDGDRRIG